MGSRGLYTTPQFPGAPQSFPRAAWLAFHILLGLEQGFSPLAPSIFRQDHLLSWGAAACTVGCLVVPLASTR